MSPISTKIKSHVYSITYPQASSKESSNPNENTGVGITNHIPFIALLEQLVNCPDFRGWKVAHVGFLTRDKAEKRNKRKEKDGDIVDIVRGEWKSDGRGRWATAGLMAELNSIKIYKIYEITYYSKPIPCVPTDKRTGYTSSHRVAKGIEWILRLPGSSYSRFGKCEVHLVANEKKLKRYQKSDGGCGRLWAEDKNGVLVDDGWFTNGLFAVCGVAADLICKEMEEKAHKVEGTSKAVNI